MAHAAPPPGYKLIWSDEFDGKELDQTKWTYRGLGPRRDAVNTKDAVKLDGQGHLVITTSKAVADGKTQYQTGMIATQGKFEHAFGYWEVSVKLQKQEGHWSAFWLQTPTMGKPVGDVAKAGTEINVFEYHSRWKDGIQHTLHWDGYGKDHQTAAFKATGKDLADGYHTIGLLWTAEKYIFYVDDKPTWETDKGVSQRGEFIILSLEVGKWAGDIAKANLPDSMYVDYVRVYDKP